MPYYGLYIPVKGGGAAASGSTATNACALGAASSSNGAGVVGLTKENETAESPFVFRTKSEALALLKQYKDARLKEFGDEEDAVKYAQTGYEIVQNKYNDIKTSTAAMEKAAFRAPTKQELVEFRKVIEGGDYERVKQIIWDNPRYLVSSGDTPSTLKEGYRYNAMHVCALSKRPQIAELILKTVSDTQFVDLLTGKKNDEKMCQELCVNLLDYYLNIPEKGRSETPLHFASKYGCPEMVEVLTSYAECKMTPNSDGMFPKDIICARVSNPRPDIVQKIESLFEERYYVPVLRCNDSSVPAQIGHPFSANDPPNLDYGPLSPDVEIKALAGPMSKDQAKKFFRRWKTPPRLGTNASSPIANNPFISPMKNLKSLPSTPRSAAAASVDIDKNLSFNSPTAMSQRRSLFYSTPQRKNSTAASETNGLVQSIVIDDPLNDGHQNGAHDKENKQEFLNKLETNNNHDLIAGPCPRTPLFKIKKDVFLSYREQNMASPVGSILFDYQGQKDFLNISDIYDSPGFKERHLKNTDTEKGIECIGRNLAKEQNVEWREYWDFLEEFVDIASEQGMQKLESYLSQRHREHEMKSSKRTRHNSDMFEEVCFALEKFGFGGSSTADAMKNLRNGETLRPENGLRNSNSTVTSNLNSSTTHQSSTPYTYVEKSLQVHARRMTKTILHNIDNAASINDALLLELRRVKSLICSFRDDESFIDVNFEKVHSRVGNLVSIFLLNSQEITGAMKEKILKIFQSLLLTPGERREHIECVCSRILHMLENKVDQILPENLKTEEMCTKIWSQEKDCDCQWESNLSRKTSRRNRLEARYKNHQRMKQQERTAAKQKITDNNVGSATDNVNSPSVIDSSDDAEEEAFWSDFGGSDSEEDDAWFTPPESPSRQNMTEITDDDGYKVFIYGNEPTKRDLDVLNAIFHVDVDKLRHPTIQCWKAALMRYSNEEMDFFPSPRVVKKSPNVSCVGGVHKSDGLPLTPSSSHKPRQLIRSNTASMILAGSPRLHTSSLSASSMSLNQPITREPILQLPAVKRLFMSPGRSKSMCAGMLPSKTTTDDSKKVEATSSVVITPTPLESTQAPRANRSFLTPLNKLRGLFSNYREQLDNSPIPSTLNDRNSNDGSINNLSLFNTSDSE